jgi:hypothetical protein
MALNNCTMSSASVTSAGGATDLATQTLLITPNPGFIVTNDMFSVGGRTFAQNGSSLIYTNGVNGVSLPTGVESVTISSSPVVNPADAVINVVVDIANSYAMPSANTTFTIDVSGDAILYASRSYDVSGTWDAVVGANVTPVTSSATSYSSSGNYGEVKTLFTKTFTCGSGKFFNSALSAVLTTGDAASYNITSANAYTVVSGQSYHTGTTYTVKYTFPDSDVTGGNIDFTVPAASTMHVAEDNVTSYSMSTGVIAGGGTVRTVKVYGDVGATYTITVTNEDTYYYNFTTNLFQSGSTSVAGTVGSSGSGDHYIIFPQVSDDDAYVLTFAASGTSTLSMAQTNPLTINQVINKSVTWSTASASGRSFTSAPTYVKSGPVGGVAASAQVASFIYLLTDDVDMVLTRAPLYSDFVLTNVGNNGTTNCDVVNEVITTSPAYSVGMAPFQSLSVANEHRVYSFGTQGATAVLALDNFINIPPVAQAMLEIQVVNNTAKSFTLTATDANSDTMTFTLVSAPTKGTVVITSASGAAVYTPTDANSVGSDSFTFKVNDTYQDSAAVQIDLNIAAA